MHHMVWTCIYCISYLTGRSNSVPADMIIINLRISCLSISQIWMICQAGSTLPVKSLSQPETNDKNTVSSLCKIEPSQHFQPLTNWEIRCFSVELPFLIRVKFKYFTVKQRLEKHTVKCSNQSTNQSISWSSAVADIQQTVRPLNHDISLCENGDWIQALKAFPLASIIG